MCVAIRPPCTSFKIACLDLAWASGAAVITCCRPSLAHVLECNILYFFPRGSRHKGHSSMTSSEHLQMEPHVLHVLEEVPLDVLMQTCGSSCPTPTAAVSERHASVPDAFPRTSSRPPQLTSPLACKNNEPASVAAGSVAWFQTVQKQAAFLSRLPLLTSLEIANYSGDTDLATTMLSLGTPSRGRLTGLSLHGPSLHSMSASASVAAFPHLQRLSLRSTSESMYRIDGGKPSPGPFFVDDGAFYPLASSPLTQASKLGCSCSETHECVSEQTEINSMSC